jgi:hypothetical protein
MAAGRTQQRALPQRCLPSLLSRWKARERLQLHRGRAADEQACQALLLMGLLARLRGVTRHMLATHADAPPILLLVTGFPFVPSHHRLYPSAPPPSALHPPSRRIPQGVLGEVRFKLFGLLPVLLAPRVRTLTLTR